MTASASRLMSRVIWLSVLAGLIALAVWSYRAWRQPDTDQRYRTQPVSRGDVVQSVSATGTLNPVRVVSVGTQVSGTVRKLYVDFNARVKQGQILLELDPDLTQAKLAQSQAALNSARAKLELAQAKAVRMRDLFRQQYISRQELDEAEADLAANKAQYAQASAQVRSDSVNVGNTVIRSPVDGVVIDRQVDEGQTVAASFQTPTLIKIAQDLSRMQINASFAEADLGKLKEGQAASFRVDAFPNADYDGVIRQIRLNPTTQQNVVTYDVVIDVANPDQKLLPGMTAYVDIALDRREQALLVPNAALRFRPRVDDTDKKAANANSDRGAGKAGRKGGRGLARVYVLRNGQPVEIRLKTGISDGKVTEVVSGELKEGTPVIIGDNQAQAAGKGQSQAGPQAMRRF